MKEVHFRHYYHMDEINQRPADTKRYLSQNIYCAYGIRLGQVLKQDVTEMKFRSEVFEICMNQHDWKSSIIPLPLMTFITIPVQLSNPTVSTFSSYSRWYTQPKHNNTYYYVMRFSGPSCRIGKYWSTHREYMNINFVGYSNMERKDLFFDYRRCAEYCNSRNALIGSISFHQVLVDFFETCATNAFLLNLKEELCI